MYANWDTIPILRINNRWKTSIFWLLSIKNSIICFVAVSDENVKKNIKSMEKQLKQLETDLKTIKKSVDDKDKFADVMNISFYLTLFSM